MKDEIVLYQPDDTIKLEVRLEDETVWLTQQQMADLFQKNRTVITRHINNIFQEGELDEKSNVHFLHFPFSDKPTKVYNLDVIISVGYRVKSLRGTQFRRWANRVLKEYLLRGYAINQRLMNIENQLVSHQEQLSRHQEKIDFFVRTSLPPKEGIFADGQIYDAFHFIERLIKSAKKSILLIDNYVDESVLTMMSEKGTSVTVDIYTQDISKALTLAMNKFNSQYGGLSIHHIGTIHDRFLIIDDQTIYLIGASLKDAGKRLFAFTQMSAERITELKKIL